MLNADVVLLFVYTNALLCMSFLRISSCNRYRICVSSHNESQADKIRTFANHA